MGDKFEASLPKTIKELTKKIPQMLKYYQNTFALKNVKKKKK